MFGFVHRIKDRETAELLVDSLESYRRLYEYNGAHSLRQFLRSTASFYVEATAHSGGYTPVFQFDNELSDFEFTAVLDPQYVLGPKGIAGPSTGFGPLPRISRISEVVWPQAALHPKRSVRNISREGDKQNSAQ